jgi:leader peptidase (prepilin peptidase)/N-methyltransferase
MALLIFLIGLCIGSFLNVVIYRLPLMLNAEALCEPSSVNLALPASHCPACKKPLRWFHNMPLFSFLFLKGCCAFCHARISWRYPLVEGITALLTVLLFYHSATLPIFLGSALLSYGLIALFFIDVDHFILPDEITLGLLWLGLFFNLFTTFIPLENAVIGAMAGYSFLFLFMHLYRLITGKIGMGHGDFKLFAALGAFFGWQALPLLLVFSTISGIIVGGFLLIKHKKSLSAPIPFGPFLAVAGVLMLFLHGILEI